MIIKFMFMIKNVKFLIIFCPKMGGSKNGHFYPHFWGQKPPLLERDFFALQEGGFTPQKRGGQGGVLSANFFSEIFFEMRGIFIERSAKFGHEKMPKSAVFGRKNCLKFWGGTFGRVSEIRKISRNSSANQNRQ